MVIISGVIEAAGVGRGRAWLGIAGVARERFVECVAENWLDVTLELEFVPILGHEPPKAALAHRVQHRM